jgi:hypothetical protein
MSDKEQLEYMEYLLEYYNEEYKGHESYHKSLTKNSRKNNGKNEVENIKDIVKHLNQSTVLGKELIKDLKNRCCLNFKRAEIRNGSNRKTHYDFILVDTDGKEYQVEHKGSYKYKKIKDGDKPWKNSVQFINAGCEKFNISRLYAKLWYDEYIISGYLSKIYKLESGIPTFNTWYKSDCCSQGEPKTLFGKEFKTFYRNEYGSNKSPLSLRIKINKKILELIKSDNKILEDFNISAVGLADKHLKEKHIWLQLNGDINGDIEKIEFKWFNEFKVNETYKIQNIKITSDIDFMFISDITGYMDFSCKLRWGKGCGFSNLRVGFQ